MSRALAYAKALKEVLKKEDFESFFKIVKNFNQLFKDQEIEAFFLSPAYPAKLKKQALAPVFNYLAGSTPRPIVDILKKFLYLLLDKKCWREYSLIVQQLEGINKNLAGYESAEILSSTPLSTETKQQLQKKLEGIFKKSIVLKEKLSSQISAGIKIKCGGFVFDDRLSFHIKQMEKQVRSSFYESSNK